MNTMEAVRSLRAYADGYAGNIRGMCALAADLLETLVPRWISVEDRLPENDVPVLSETFDLLCEFDDVLEIAAGYNDHERFAAALCVASEERGVELPDEWWDCLVEDYTHWQKRFAEICREVIVPELRKLVDCNE